MKTLKKLFLILIITLCAACNPDDDSNNNTVDASIIGELQLESIDFIGFSEPLDDCERMQKLTFAENGELAVYFDTSGNCDFSTRTIFYTLDNTNLTVNSPNEGINGSDYIIRNTIETLSETTLIFVEVGDNEEGDYAPEDYVKYTYTKVN